MLLDLRCTPQIRRAYDHGAEVQWNAQGKSFDAMCKQACTRGQCKSFDAMRKPRTVLDPCLNEAIELVEGNPTHAILISLAHQLFTAAQGEGFG